MVEKVNIVMPENVRDALERATSISRDVHSVVLPVINAYNVGAIKILAEKLVQLMIKKCGAIIIADHVWMDLRKDATRDAMSARAVLTAGVR